MDAEENQRQVSLRAHRPWKSQTARFPHSHRRDEAVGKWKAKSRLPTFPQHGLLSRNQNRKEARRRSLRDRLQAHLAFENKPALQAHPSMRICYHSARTVSSMPATVLPSKRLKMHGSPDIHGL
jgi:hypothetical protein